MIVIGTTRKPSQRIRSFVKELVRVIPGAMRLTRGKRGLDDFCAEAQENGADRVLLVGAFHGNPGRIGFLQYNGDSWHFHPPTVILKSVNLLRNHRSTPPRPVQALYVVPDTPQDTKSAEILAQVLNAPVLEKGAFPSQRRQAALLRVNLRQRQELDFVSLDETEPMGPTLLVKRFLSKPMGTIKRW